MAVPVFVTITVLIIAFAVLVNLSYKGLGAVFAPLLAAVLVALVAQSGFSNALFSIFPTGAGTFLQRIMMPAISGTLFGEIFAASGAAKTIGIRFTRLLGKDNGVYIVMLLTLVLTLCGMTLIVFTVAALGHALMKEADLPPHIAMVAYIGMNEITAFCVPGVPHPINILPTPFLSTNLYAGAIPGIAGAISGYLLLFVFIKYLIWSARRKQVGYSTVAPLVSEDEELDDRVLPDFKLALLPLAAVLIASPVFQLVLGMESVIAVFFSQTIAVILLLVFCRKFFIRKTIRIVQDAAANSSLFLLSCGAMVGFASVVSDTTLYTSVMDMLTSLQINPYVFTVIAAGALTVVTAEANTGVILFLQTFGKFFTENPAVDLGAVHRLSIMTAAGLDSLPHSGNVLMNLRVFGLDHKSGYKYVFITSIIIPSIDALVGLGAQLVFGK